MMLASAGRPSYDLVVGLPQASVVIVLSGAGSIDALAPSRLSDSETSESSEGAPLSVSDGSSSGRSLFEDVGVCFLGYCSLQWLDRWKVEGERADGRVVRSGALPPSSRS